MTTNYQIGGSNFEGNFIRRDLFSQGGLWGSGENTYGTLGDGTTTQYRSSPVQTSVGGTNWKQVAGGNIFTLGLKTDGTIWGWGRNQYGTLGNGTNSVGASPTPTQVTIAAGTVWNYISASQLNGAAIKSDGTMWTWGYGGFGELGDNTSVSKSSPVMVVGGGAYWKLAACGAYHMAGIKTDGTLWTWGQNTYGQLGIGATSVGTSTSSPVQTVASGTNWKTVSCGTQHTYAIKTDGTLWTWGTNAYGQLGDNTIVDKNSPVQTIAGGTNWKSVSTYQWTLAGIKTDGTLWLSGRNQYGQLGDSTLVNKSSPIQTIAGGTNWKQVSPGNLFTAAIKTDGTLWLWGFNGYYNFGDGTNVSTSSPVQVTTVGSNWKTISSGLTHLSKISDIF